MMRAATKVNLSLVAMSVLVALAIAGAAKSATPAGPYQGKAATLLTASAPDDLRIVRKSTSSLTSGSRPGLRAAAGADYEGTTPCSSSPDDPAPCSALSLRVLVFKTPTGARTHWNGSCPDCSYRKAQGGWPFKRLFVRQDPTARLTRANHQTLKVIALCGNLVVALKGTNWGGDDRYARPVVQAMIDAAVASGMTPCDPLKQAPATDVFARGSAEGRGKAVAVGSVAAPKRVYLRVRSSGYGELYVDWTLTCTNGRRTETTHDEGLAKIPLTIELPVGIVGATKCNATASAVSVASRNYEVTGTHVVELLSR